MITITLDGVKILVEKRNNIFQICEFLKKEIPRFCYHKDLIVAGNCRMCLVEVERMPKPVASCAMPVAENMVIYTDSPLVRKARESVLEFLLLNHPLDCPICDQGGECDLQDQSFIYGSDTSRFYHIKKRVVEDKNISVLIKTVMTRCIHCTRCVRFASEIAGLDILGTSGRGNSTEIGFYVENILTTELSGNVIDLCPVGALTSKPYAFSNRPWDLISYSTVDLNDAVGAHIKVDVSNNQISRISPKLYWEINDSWISDKSRYCFDGLKYQNINKIFYKKKNIFWKTHLNYFRLLNTALNTKTNKFLNIRIICGEDSSLDSLEKIQNFSFLSGFGTISSVSAIKTNIDFESNYKFNSSFIGTESSDCILLISSNLRYDAPNLNIKIKKNKNSLNTSVYYVGPYYKNTYDMKHLCVSEAILQKIVKGKHPLCRVLENSKKPQIILGSCHNLIKDINKTTRILNSLKKRSKNLMINFLAYDAGSIGSMDLGIDCYKPRKTNTINYLFNIHRKYNPLLKEAKNFFLTIYQNYQGNVYANNAHILIPRASIFEKSEYYNNLQNKIQQTTKTIFTKNSFFTEVSFLKEHLVLLQLMNNINTNPYFNFLNFKNILQYTNKPFFVNSINLNHYNDLNKTENIVNDFFIKKFYNTNNMVFWSPIFKKIQKQTNLNKNF